MKPLLYGIRECWVNSVNINEENKRRLHGDGYCDQNTLKTLAEHDDAAEYG